MKQVTPNGKLIKRLRSELERLSTQKELAHDVGLSERKLRQIENEDAPISATTLDRLAKAFNVHREQISLPVPELIAAPVAGENIFDSIVSDMSKERLIPRYDYDLADVTMDEGLLFTRANSSHDFRCEITVPLSDETAQYAEELIKILNSLTWSVRSILDKVDSLEEIAIRRRIKQLLVLLRGNDIWVYQTHLYRQLPERHTPLPEGEYADLSSRFVIALGPPGEYGETTLRVPIDHGQPFYLPAWKPRDRDKAERHD
jgi:transcriptional regulator with XRE-family HTH domain